MKNTDKFLIAIVAGVILLVGVAFTVVLIHPKPTYLPDNSAEGVAHNYLFSVEQGDYPRAYNYLSVNLKARPASVEQFARGAHLFAYRAAAKFTSARSINTCNDSMNSKPKGYP